MEERPTKNTLPLQSPETDSSRVVLGLYHFYKSVGSNQIERHEVHAQYFAPKTYETEILERARCTAVGHKALSLWLEARGRCSRVEFHGLFGLLVRRPVPLSSSSHHFTTIVPEFQRCILLSIVVQDEAGIQFCHCPCGRQRRCCRAQASSSCSYPQLRRIQHR